MLGIASEHQAAYLNLEFRIFVNTYITLTQMMYIKLIKQYLKKLFGNGRLDHEQITVTDLAVPAPVRSGSVSKTIERHLYPSADPT